MFWADELLKNRKGKEWINDAWTPSGILHMGGLKGPVIHDTLYRIIKGQGGQVKFSFGFDDFDPIDGLPASLQKTHEKYMGVPIYIAPSPDGKGSFGNYYGNKMRAMFKILGINAEIYLASDYYKKGVYNDAIKLVLDKADIVRKVYADMYKKPINSDWFPLQVICPNCGKLGTTKVTAWDGKEVSYVCSPDMVKWAAGCGHSGKISPFDGNAKMPYKVEWAAKWATFGVTIEGAGKDHASAGGTYDVAIKIVKSVFQKDPPLKLPYEFFLWNGKKMSSSKGLGLTGEELLQVLSPESVRFLMIRTEPKKAVEFNPVGTDIVPKLYDEYQKAANAYFCLKNIELTKNDDLARSFELSQIGKIEKPPSVRFSTLAQLVQMPNMQEYIKKEGAEQWAKFAKVWLEKFAPDSEKFIVSEKVPDEARKLSDLQKKFLSEVASSLKKDWEGEEFQKFLYELSKQLEIPAKEAFAAIYVSLIGKNHGPKAAWLILSLDKKFVEKRFNEVQLLEPEDKNEITKLNNPEIFSIHKEIKNAFPSVSIGIAIIKDVKIDKVNEKLEEEKKEILSTLQDLNTEKIGQYPEVLSYRKLYKLTDIDWHSRRPSPEALLRRIALKKGLYTINTCVDAYNLIVMKHRVSVGAFDLDQIKLPTVLRFAKAGEEILLLGDTEPTKYKDGEVAYFDQKGGYNMDFNYRDAKRTAVQLNTNNLLINVDGVYDITPQKVEDVLKETCDKILKYCGGTIEEFGIVSGQ